MHCFLVLGQLICSSSFIRREVSSHQASYGARIILFSLPMMMMMIVEALKSWLAMLHGNQFHPVAWIHLPIHVTTNVGAMLFRIIYQE